jgi:hypothetical protein
MAPLTIEGVIKRLETSATAGYDLSSQLYRVLQVLPSAVFEYGSFASQILYLASNLERVGNILPALKLTDDLHALKDLETLVNLADEACSEVRHALPQRPFDGAEVDLILPFDAHALEDQIEALQVGATMVMAVFQVEASRSSSENIVPMSRRFAEAIVNQLKKAVRDLKCSQPKDRHRRGAALKRAKTHAAITKFLDELLVTVSGPVDAANEEAKDEGDKDQPESKSLEIPREEQELVKLEHFGAHPKEDGMPEHIHHNPDNVYAKVHVKDVDTRSLIYYNLPYSKAKENPNYYIIWKPMEPWECENVFQHTKKLRINEQHASISATAVVSHLLEKWLGVVVQPSEQNPDVVFEELEKNLAELKAQDEKRKTFERPMIRRDRSWSPSPPPRERYPLPRRVPRYRPTTRFGQTSKTEYWRSWEGQPATLNNALHSVGWQPVYMRGTDAGQTWFYGQDVIHVRRFTDDYTPQERVIQTEEDIPEVKEYLIIGTEWLEEEALSRHGFKFQLLPSGHYALDPRLTWVSKNSPAKNSRTCANDAT